jgi:signal transduction histidine kinase
VAKELPYGPRIPGVDAGAEEPLAESEQARVRTLTETVERQRRELAILAEVAARVHSEDDEQKVFEIALDVILERLGLTAAWIFTGDERDRQLHLTASRGVSPSYLEEVRVQGLADCLCPEVFGRGQRMQAHNTTQCPRMPRIVEGLAAPVAHACIPLKFEGGTMGVLNLAARPGQLFSDAELAFLETLGHQVGLAVERARHQKTERLRNQEARAMAAVSKAVGVAMDPAAVLNAIGRSALDLLGAERVAVLLGADPTAMRVAHLDGLPHPELREGQTLDLVLVGARLQIQALQERAALAVDDWSNDPRVNAELARRWDAGAGLVLPMLAREHVLGLLVLTRRQASRWTEEQVDVAEAFAAQAALKLDNARLYDDTRRAYEELSEAQDRVIQQEKMAVLGTFASGLAHEVRNPLNSIGLQLTVLERRISRLEAPLAREMQDLAAIIRDEVRRLDRLVGDFLLFARSGRLLEASGDLDGVAADVVTLLAPEADAVGVRLEWRRLGAPARRLRMDAEKMKQVVINLVRNGIEAQPSGGEVVVESGMVDDKARLVVHDSGPGLPAGIDVFQLFVTTKAKGTGLGLSIVQQIVRHHGGSIHTGRGPRGGASFTIDLPAAQPRVEEGDHS